MGAAGGGGVIFSTTFSCDSRFTFHPFAVPVLSLIITHAALSTSIIAPCGTMIRGYDSAIIVGILFSLGKTIGHFHVIYNQPARRIISNENQACHHMPARSSDSM
jgi:hypothetical protein